MIRKKFKKKENIEFEKFFKNFFTKIYEKINEGKVKEANHEILNLETNIYDKLVYVLELSDTKENFLSKETIYLIKHCMEIIEFFIYEDEWTNCYLGYYENRYCFFKNKSKETKVLFLNTQNLMKNFNKKHNTKYSFDSLIQNEIEEIINLSKKQYDGIVLFDKQEYSNNKFIPFVLDKFMIIQFEKIYFNSKSFLNYKLINHYNNFVPTITFSDTQLIDFKLIEQITNTKDKDFYNGKVKFKNMKKEKSPKDKNKEDDYSFILDEDYELDERIEEDDLANVNFEDVEFDDSL